VALFLIAIILITQFNSVALPFIIMVSVILSLIGVLIGLLVVGLPFGIIMTGVGVISLAGVVVNNAIVLIDYIQLLRERGLGRREALVQAGMVRLRPVLLTAITTILGLVPMATGFSFNFREFRFVFGSSSSQWWGSMAVAVIFGLAFATLLTLIVVPTMYGLIDSMKEKMTRKTPIESAATE
jgi:multidrug efflux pump subunit AcrB